MVTRNPSLSIERINQPLKVVASLPRESLLSWLESSGRLRSSEFDEVQDHKISDDLDDILEPDNYASENEEEQTE